MSNCIMLFFYFCYGRIYKWRKYLYGNNKSIFMSA